MRILKGFSCNLKGCYVYIHRKQSDGTIFYVGKGVKHRWSVVFSRSLHWKNTAKKHGVVCEIVANSLTDNEAFLLEKKLIQLYGRQDNGTGILVNQTSGGDGVVGYIFTDEHRKKISEWSKTQKHSSETILKIKNSNTGLKRSDQTRINISKSKKGIKLSEKQLAAVRLSCENFKIKVLCVETGIVYPSLIEAAADVSGDHSCISKVCQGKRKKHMGFTWKYLEISN